MINPPKIIVYLDQDGPLADFELGIGRDTNHPDRGVYTGDKDVIKPMYEKGFFRNLPVTAGAKEAVEELLNIERIDWYIATKPMVDKVYYSASEKFEWLEEHFPMLVKKTFMTCCKGHLNGHYLIDDHKEAWESVFGGTFLHFDVKNPVSSWEEIVNYLKKYDPNSIPFQAKKKPEYKALWRPVKEQPALMGRDFEEKQIQLQIKLDKNTLMLATLSLMPDGECWLIHYKSVIDFASMQDFMMTAVEVANGRERDWKMGTFKADIEELRDAKEPINIRTILEDKPWPMARANEGYPIKTRHDAFC